MKTKTIKCHFCGQQMEAEEKLKNFHICPPEEYSEEYPLGGSLEPYDIEKDKQLI